MSALRTNEAILMRRQRIVEAFRERTGGNIDPERVVVDPDDGSYRILGPTAYEPTREDIDAVPDDVARHALRTKDMVKFIDSKSPAAALINALITHGVASREAVLETAVTLLTE